ncbi:MAG: succinate:quinone oxidoreductase [Deltaproteobacteria bacterium]|nr:MAG: succinate:quinone oxidoreductase [Deltaproteobacteria bacterium]
MRWLSRFLRSSIGAKMLMAVTGAALLLFVIAHMLGNLQVFLGPSAINGYAHSLRMMPGLLWTARIGLLVAVVLHIVSGIRVTSLNRAARPERYRGRQYRAATMASRSMPVSGLVIFAFVAYHLAHYTLMWVNPEFKTFTDDLGRHDVYRMVVTGFSNKGVAALYIIAVGLLCSHLAHGIPSFFQTLGLRHPKFTPAIEVLGPAIAIVLFLGFAAVPVGVMAKWVTLAGGVG